MIILPFMSLWVRELFMATDFLFILPLLPLVGSQSISRDLKRERETEDKSSGERQMGSESARTEQNVEIYLCCLSVCGHIQGDKCLREASGISSVIMEHVNWFCNDFHLCLIPTSCILVTSNPSLWLHLLLTGIRKHCNERLALIGKQYFLFCFHNIIQYDYFNE